MTIKNLDKYLDPPDEPEIPLCEACGDYEGNGGVDCRPG